MSGPQLNYYIVELTYVDGSKEKVTFYTGNLPLTLEDYQKYRKEFTHQILETNVK